jgi:cobalt/nickel transport protein
MRKKGFFSNNIILFVLVVLIALLPIVFLKEAEFEGADDQAEDIIAEIDADYEPWFSNLWEPPSGEIESLLFALQAALGAGFIGYFFGRYTQKNVTG